MPRSYLPRRFRYTTTLRDAFLRDGIASLLDLDDRGWVAGSDANAFVCNHDTERVCLFRCLSLVDDTDTPPRTPSHSTHIRLRTRTRWLPSSPCMPIYLFVQDLFLTTGFLVSPSAHPYGTPSVLSSYSNFYDNNAGGPNGGMNCF